MSDNATLYGGEDMQVTRLDKKTETVRVRQLPIDDYPRYGMLLTDSNDYTMAAFYCGKEESWVRQLTPGSIIDINGKGQELNLNFFSRWLEQSTSRLKIMNPSAYQAYERKFNEHLDKLAGSPSPEPSHDSHSRQESPSIKPGPIPTSRSSFSRK